LAAHSVIKRYVRLLVVAAALAVPGAVGDLASPPDDRLLPEQPSFVASLWIASTAPPDADVRSGPDAGDDESSELAETASVYMAADSTGAALRLRVAAASPPNPGSLPASQDTPGASASRAPPLL